ncbi:MAG: ATP-dependent DNA helicase [Bacilli bacterium]|nr:ATP-dependent DNA helicase [Bacilli bacterium]
MKEKKIELSVHQLVDFLLRKGDIDNRIFNRSSMQEGTLLHALYQSKQGDDYISEYPLKDTIMVDEIAVTLQGRADGIIVKDGEYTIDEIKTTVIDLKEFRDANIEWHLGQAKCYAYLFAKERKLSSISVKLTYIRQGKTSEKLFDSYTFLFDDLERDIYDLVSEYIEFYNIILRAMENRDKTIATLDFPFDNYRKGQRELAKYSYSVAINGGSFFVEAPTGIGKTMSTLYPFIKAIKDDEKAKIFYLTAKNSGKLNAHNAVKILKENGLFLTNILITAKEKICFCKESACNPDECPFARGYYNKIKNVIKESLLSFDDFDYETIVYMAKKYEICPFEFELDLSLFSDVIICDYNYLFDPVSYMKRFFDEDSSHYLALVDEAHNLISRSRDMYSASLDRKYLDDAKKSLRGTKNKKLKTMLSRMKKMFSRYEELEDGEHEFIDLDIKDMRDLEYFVNTYQEVNKEDNKDISKEMTSLYLEVNRFKRISELFSDNYLFYVHVEEGSLTLNLLCLDASKYLKSILNRIKGAVLFSATLSPIDYYINVLGGDSNSPRLSLDSPFPSENLKILVAPKISIKYKNREKTYQEVADYIKAFISHKVGNYFVYLPSYEYQERLLEYLDLPTDVTLHVQKKDMSDYDKELFLANFQENPNSTHVALAIVGGAFGEGIDLVSDRLIGLVIVGIGLSKINYESNKIVEYFKSIDLDGYNYAYVFPGMNKIMQAVGRLIRSENDRGVALLIDERYMTRAYQDLFRDEWKDYEVIMNTDDLNKTIKKFFKH